MPLEIEQRLAAIERGTASEADELVPWNGRMISKGLMAELGQTEPRRSTAPPPARERAEPAPAPTRRAKTVEEIFGAGVSDVEGIPREDKEALARQIELLQSTPANFGDVVEVAARLKDSVLILHQRTKLMSQRIAELERTPLKYCGTWEAAAGVYPKNTVITHNGSLWIAIRPTQQRPGDGGDGWQLCAKGAR